MKMKQHRLLVLCGLMAAMMMVAVPAMARKATSVSLNHSSYTRYSTTIHNDALNTHKSVKLKATIKPNNATANSDASLVQYTSSNAQVAEVDQSGNVLAVNPGKATITVKLTDGSNKSAKCTVTVKALPALTISLNLTTKKMEPGSTFQLVPALGPATIQNKEVTYTSSNKKVATVSSTGLVTAVANGTAHITASPKSRPSLKATIAITVDYKYRFFGISNGVYLNPNDNLENWRPDLLAMKTIIDGARFDDSRVKFHYKANMSGSAMRKYLEAIANYKAIGPEDVTIFYYSGHGMNPGVNAQYDGALVGVDFNASKFKASQLLTIGELTNYLRRIPGQVVVILDSCFSGQFISTKGGEVAPLSKSQLDAINKNIVAAFADASAGNQSSAVTAKDLSPSTHAQFHVITGSANDESSYALMGAASHGLWPGGEYRSLLTYAIQEGTMGANQVGQLRADLNGDKVISLHELYQYVAPRAQGILQAVPGWTNQRQSVQVWPANDSFGVFAIN